jgi:predicted DNA-binding transcriptional regulator YafY
MLGFTATESVAAMEDACAMTDTMHRHWDTLRLIPRAPNKATAEQIQEGLRTRGYRVSKRTVERDLDKLSTIFPLESDDRSKPFGWRWAKHAMPLDVPAMDLPTALTLHFVNEHVASLLPQSVRSHLAPHLGMAERTLDAHTGSPLKRWTRKVMVIPQGQPLLAPEVKPGVMDTVYEAVLTERRLKLHYRPQAKTTTTKRYTASPLGLVWRNRVCYLVVTLFDYEDLLQLALHRIERATVLDEPVKVPKGFSLKRYVEEGAFDYPIGGKPIKLKAIFTRDAAYHLRETPLSKDQRITDIDEHHVRLTATVADTHQLRWWLLSFGDEVVVEGPIELREHLRNVVSDMGVNYGRPESSHAELESAENID